MGCAALALALGCGGSADPTMADAAVPVPDGPPPVADGPPPDKGMPPLPITIKTFEATSSLYGGGLANAALVAFQDGPSSAWVALNGSNGVYQATATSDRYAVAVGCADAISSEVRLYYQALSDTTEVHAVGCRPAAADTVELTVDLTGIPATDDTEVWLGGTVADGAGGSAITQQVAKGPVDVFAYSYIRQQGTRVPIKLYRLPTTLDVQAAQTLTIDLATAGQPLERHALTLTGLDPAEAATVHSSYATPHSELQWPLLNELFTDMNERYTTLAPGLRQPDDVSNLTVTAARAGSDGRRYQRQVRHALKTPRDVTEVLPAALEVSAPTIDWPAGPRATLTIPLTPATQRFVEYVASLSTLAPDTFNARSLTVYVEPGWAAGAASTTITTPDLSGLAGWTADMALATGLPVSWSVERTDGNMSAETPPVDGRVFLNSIVSGTLAP